MPYLRILKRTGSICNFLNAKIINHRATGGADTDQQRNYIQVDNGK
jgi:hypothetical protein